MDIQRLKKLLKCPVCFDLPAPGSTELGICSFGHLTCLPCGNNILLKKPVGNCPLCRDDSFKITRGHQLAMYALDLLNDHIMYPCKYPDCPLEMSGNNMVMHQKTCSFKPVKCPKNGCKEESKAFFLMEDQHCHKLCLRVETMQADTESWNFTININQLYSYDTNKACVSDKFKPALLKREDEVKSCAYVNAITKPNVILFYIGWMDQRDHVNNAIKELNIGMNVYINTKTGKIGQYICRPPKFSDEKIVLNEEGIFLTKHTLFCWALWANEYHCHECNCTYPHVHVSVFFKK